MKKIRKSHIYIKEKYENLLKQGKTSYGAIIELLDDPEVELNTYNGVRCLLIRLGAYVKTGRIKKNK